MNIAPEPAAQDLLSLLAECALPVADISPSLPAQFFGVRSGQTLAAAIGLELYPPFGLLRSLAVAPSQRRRGLARALVNYAESFAASHDIEELFLLTTTADHFFRALGYSNATRAAAPLAIQATSQFASLCPVSSSFLSKHVVAAA